VYAGDQVSCGLSKGVYHDAFRRSRISSCAFLELSPACLVCLPPSDLIYVSDNLLKSAQLFGTLGQAQVPEIPTEL